METTEFFEKILKEQPLFEGMGDQDITMLAGCCKNVRFKPNEVVFRDDDLADTFYIVREGNVAVDIRSPDSGAITIQTVGAGEVLGWSWLYPPYVWHFDARAVNDARAVALDAKCLRGKCENDPRLGYELMKRFSSIMLERIHATRMQLMDIYGPDPKAVV